MNLIPISQIFCAMLGNRRERVRKKGRITEDRRTEKNSGEKKEELHIWREGRKRILLEGTQTMPARPSCKGRMTVKTLGW
jgi:hypothetical protein